MLRREKKTTLRILGPDDAAAAADDHALAAGADALRTGPTLTKKLDLVVWIRISKVQQEIYEHFLESEEVKALLNTTRSPLVGKAYQLKEKKENVLW